MKFIIKSLIFIVLCSFILPVYSKPEISENFDAVDSGDHFEKDDTNPPDVLSTDHDNLCGVRSEFKKRVIVKGIAILDRCIMKKKVISYGTLKANATDFLRDLIIRSGAATLNSCGLTDLYIQDHDPQSPIEVILDGYTVVHGSIIFESGKGKVYKSSNTCILGEVVGGELIDLHPEQLASN